MQVDKLGLNFWIYYTSRKVVARPSFICGDSSRGQVLARSVGFIRPLHRAKGGGGEFAGVAQRCITRPGIVMQVWQP